MTRRSWVLFAAMCVIWGVPYLLIRIAVRDVAPGTLVFLRTAVGGLLLLPLAFARGGFGPVLRRWRPLVAFSAIEMAVPWVFLSSAEQRLPSSLTGLLVAAVPLVGVLVARLIGSDERADRVQWLGLLVGLVGVAMLVGLDVGDVPIGPLLEVLVVVVGYAVAPVIMARSLADLPSLPVVCASLLVVALAYLPYAVVRWPGHVAATGLASIAVLAVVCTALAFLVFFALISAIGPARAVVITYVNPAVAVLAGVAFLAEPFTLGMAVGFPLILLGSVLAARRRASAAVGDGQSMRTVPAEVSKSAATSPVPSPPAGTQLTAIPSSGCSADVPR